MKILGKACEVHPEVPAPLPFSKFAVLSAGFVFYVYIVVRALVSFFGKG